MLTITIKGNELWDEKKGEFIDVKGQTLQLEHSLVSISKWESKWHKPFISSEKRTREETIDYIRCMTLTQNVDPMVYMAVTSQQINEVNAYIDDPMSAKTFRKTPGKGRVYSSVTSEDIYSLMVSYQIPFECKKWHFNRLMALIKTCEENNNDGGKMKKNEYADFRRRLNAARRAKYNTRG